MPTKFYLIVLIAAVSLNVPETVALFVIVLQPQPGQVCLFLKIWWSF